MVFPPHTHSQLPSLSLHVSHLFGEWPCPAMFAFALEQVEWLELAYFAVLSVPFFFCGVKLWILKQYEDESDPQAALDKDVVPSLTALRGRLLPLAEISGCMSPRVRACARGLKCILRCPTQRCWF